MAHGLFSRLTVPLTVFATAASLLLGGCTNERIRRSQQGILSSQITPGSSPQVPSYVLAQVNVVSLDATNEKFQVLIDTKTSATGSALDACSPADATSPGKPCACVVSWTDPSLAAPRRIDTAVSHTETGLLECPVPPGFRQEVDKSTPLLISLIGTGARSGSFKSNTLQFSLASLPSSNSIAWTNVFRHVCFDTFRRSGQIQNFRPSTPMQGGLQGLESKVPVWSNAFMLGAEEQSTQLYPYHFYSSGTAGTDGKTLGNGFYCPTVTRESAGGAPNVEDSTFALSEKANESFTVKVETPRAFLPDQGTTLGYALKPLLAPAAAAGSCPKIGDLPTYRLRRYFLTLPARYAADGKLIPGSQPSLDLVYVLDRPVAAKDPLGHDVTYLIAGPKPCPFAWKDVKGTSGTFSAGSWSETGGNAGKYVATNDPAWSGVNLDGIELPRTDQAAQSCSASLLLLSEPSKAVAWSLGTVSSHNPSPRLQRVPMRPMEAWSPAWQEDTSFLACAPEPQAIGGVTPRQAPIEVARVMSGSGSTLRWSWSWCAKTLPNENGVGGGLTAQSEEPKRSIAATSLAAPFNEALLVTPLQAPVEDISRLFQDEPSYQCSYTFDEGRGKVGKAQPPNGCCGINTNLPSLHFEEPAVTCLKPLD